MKTYYLFCLFFACAIVSCSKADPISEPEDPIEVGAKANYTLLVTSDGMLKALPLDATAELIGPNPGESPFTKLLVPDLTFKEGSELLTYHKKSNCLGELNTYDFSDHSSSKIEVFGDLGSCNLTVSAIAQTSNTIYIGYVLQATVKTYFVRVLDTSTTEPSFVDIELDEKPAQFAVSNNRLFILTFDEEVTDENSITVMDMNSKSLIYNANLGYNVRKIFKNKEGNIIISYDGLHTVFNASSFAVQYVNYQPGTEPKFSYSVSNNLDSKGLLYFLRPMGEELHSNVPAIYDFDKNLTYLYIFENFLTEAQIKFDFEIDDTTMLSYDEKTNLLLIGYKKSSNSNKGGLLRVKPVPEPAFIDNLNVDGVPYDIFIK